MESPELHVRQVESSDFEHFFECVFVSVMGSQLASNRQHLTELQSASLSNIAMVSQANVHIIKEVTPLHTIVELPCVASPNPLRYVWYKLAGEAANTREGQTAAALQRDAQIAVIGNNRSDVKYTWVAHGHGNMIVNNIDRETSGTYKCVVQYETVHLAITVNLEIYGNVLRFSVLNSTHKIFSSDL